MSMKLRNWLRRRWLGCAIAGALLAVAGYLALAGNGAAIQFKWTYAVSEPGGMPRNFAFAEAKAQAEQFYGMELRMVGTEGFPGTVY